MINNAGARAGERTPARRAKSMHVPSPGAILGYPAGRFPGTGVLFREPTGYFRFQEESFRDREGGMMDVSP